MSRWVLLAVMWIYVEGLGLFTLAVDAWLAPATKLVLTP